MSPYIKPEDRSELNSYSRSAQTAGELNFLITLLALEYLQTKGESYQTYNDIMGALEGAKMELYRRKVSIYEDKKRDSNGEVY